MPRIVTVVVVAMSNASVPLSLAVTRPTPGTSSWMPAIGTSVSGSELFTPVRAQPRTVSVVGSGSGLASAISSEASPESTSDDEVADRPSADRVVPERQLARRGVDEQDVHAAREGAEDRLGEHASKDRLVGIGVEDLDSIENEDLGQRIRENLLDALTQEAATVERLTADFHEELAADRHRGVSMIDAGVVDADEVHLGGGTNRLVVADQLGEVDIKRPACPLLGADEGTLEAEAQAVAVEIDDVHGRS